MAAVSELVFGVAMAAVAVNAASAVLETEDKRMVTNNLGFMDRLRLAAGQFPI